MNEIDVNGRLEQLIREITDKELTIAEMEKESLLSSNVGLSPLDLLNLFFAIEREFNIKIDRKEIIEHQPCLDPFSTLEQLLTELQESRDSLPHWIIPHSMRSCWQFPSQ